MKPITFHPDAEAEITDAARYYEDRSPGLGSELLGEVERALVLILKNPEAWKRIARRVRSRSLWRFPYRMIYAVGADTVVQHQITEYVKAMPKAEQVKFLEVHKRATK